MIFANFRRPVKTSDLEDALNSTLSGLGYKILNIKKNCISTGHINNEFLSLNEGIEYEVRKNFLEPKIYFGIKFNPRIIEGSCAIFYEKEYVRQLYGWVYSLNENKYENILADVLKNTIKKVDDTTKVTNQVNITDYK